MADSQSMEIFMLSMLDKQLGNQFLQLINNLLDMIKEWFMLLEEILQLLIYHSNFINMPILQELLLILNFLIVKLIFQKLLILKVMEKLFSLFQLPIILMELLELKLLLQFKKQMEMLITFLMKKSLHFIKDQF